jgi:hypothetical protein
LSTRPAILASSAPEPETRNAVACRSAIRNDDPPDASIARLSVCSAGASSRTGERDRLERPEADRDPGCAVAMARAEDPAQELRVIMT